MATDWSNVRLASGANVDQAQSVLSWVNKGPNLRPFSRALRELNTSPGDNNEPANRGIS